MSYELPNGSRSPQPGRAKENSPPIHRWDSGRCTMSSPVRDGRNRLDHLTFSFASGGALGILRRVDPAINRWAIFGCPCGTNTTGGVEQ